MCKFAGTQVCKCASDGPPGTPGGPFPCAEWQWGALGTRADLTLWMAPAAWGVAVVGDISAAWDEVEIFL